MRTRVGDELSSDRHRARFELDRLPAEPEQLTAARPGVSHQLDKAVRQSVLIATVRTSALGELDTKRSLEAGGYRLHVGDEIVTRRNDRNLTTFTRQVDGTTLRWVSPV